MAIVSRRSVVLGFALSGVLSRSQPSSAQDSDLETNTLDNQLSCISLLTRNPAISDDEHERLMAVAEALGTRRSEFLGQPYVTADLVYALSLLCKWPFKPEPYADYRAFMNATLPEILALDAPPSEIAAQFPQDALTLDFGGLFRGLEEGTLLAPVEEGFSNALALLGP